MYPFYLGIDLHLKRTYMVLMDAKGEVIEKGRISNQEIRNIFKKKYPKRPMQCWRQPLKRVHQSSLNQHRLPSWRSRRLHSCPDQRCAAHWR